MADDFSNTATIMYPVVWPTARDPKVPYIHSTVMYLGDITENDLDGRAIYQALEPLPGNVFVWAKVIGKEKFDADTPVLLLDHPFLFDYYGRVEKALKAIGVENASEFAYRPHVTVDDVQFGRSKQPKNLMLRPVEFWFGKRRHDFI